LQSYQPLIAHWNGTAWSRSAAPKSYAAAQLRAVTAPSADDAWLLGRRVNREGIGVLPAAAPGVLRDGRVRQADRLRGLARDAFITALAGFLADVNALHPFREGNGRAQRAFFPSLAGCGPSLAASAGTAHRLARQRTRASYRDWSHAGNQHSGTELPIGPPYVLVSVADS
jgi:hypothetical protein